MDSRGGHVPVPLGAVAAATVAGGLAACAVVEIAGRTHRPRGVFLALVIAGFAVSGAAPVAAAATATTAAWLLALHVVVAVPLVMVGWRLTTSHDCPWTPGASDPEYTLFRDEPVGGLWMDGRGRERAVGMTAPRRRIGN